VTNGKWVKKLIVSPQNHVVAVPLHGGTDAVTISVYPDYAASFQKITFLRR
jgi:hypothetical protein